MTYDEPWMHETGWFKHVELEINTACDLACFACDRFSDVTNAPNMKLEQVSQFVEESLDLKWGWERIRLLGGEPTLHPQLKEMVGRLRDYRLHYPNCFIQILTNGVGKAAKSYKTWMRDAAVNLHAEQKQEGVQPAWFHNTRIAPVDRDPNVGELPPCLMFDAHGCGIGLTRHGYFLDGAGASAAKIAGLDVGVMRLSGVTYASMYEQSRILCRICGHWNDPTPGAPTVTQLVQITGQVTGPYWTEKIAAYKAKKPPMSLVAIEVGK